MVAEIRPLFKAVKNAEPNILKPQIRKDREYKANARPDSSSSAGSYPTKTLAMEPEKRIARAVSSAEPVPIRIRLLRNRFLSSK